MCCAGAILLFFGPRVLLAVMWLFNNNYLNRAYDNFIVPLLGFVFLPWTTLAYAFAVNTFGGLSGLGLIVVIVALLVDLASYGGSAYGNRRRLRA